MSTLNSTEVRKSAEIFRYRLQQTIYDSSLRMIDIPNEIGMTRGSMFRYLTGTRVPDFSHLIAIAVYFRVSLDWLTGIDSVTELKQDEKDILDLMLRASEEDRETVRLILKKYEK